MTSLAHRVRNPRALGMPLLLIHGVGDSCQVWDQVVPGLPTDRPIITYDLRGHGASAKVSGPYAIDDFVADHVALLAELEVEAVDLVGYSLGGLIAQAVALAAPETLRRLVVVSAVAGRTQRERTRALERLDEVERLGPAEVARTSVTRWFTHDYLQAHPEAEEETMARMAGLDPDCYAAAYRVLATTDLAERLGEIDQPTLAITGEHDVGSPPRMTELIARSVRHGRAVVLPGVRHSVLQEAPEEVSREVASFVR